MRSVAAARGTPPVELEVRDLDEAGREDPELLARLSTLVPVLEVDGVQVARWVVAPSAPRCERTLDARRDGGWAGRRVGR